MLLRPLIASLSALLPASLAGSLSSTTLSQKQTEQKQDRQQQQPQEQTIKESATLKLFEQRSPLMSAFWGRDMHMRAGVVLPPDFKQDERLPVCYSIHGFGGSHLSAVRREKELVDGMKMAMRPRMIYVHLDASCSLGHHEFADSVNCGPWGTALIYEFVPALEAHFHAYGKPNARFVTGHSSGGWSSLWLQVSHPDFFGGTWSTAPDSVDFREFTGINVYDFTNAYVGPDGKPIQLIRQDGKWVATVQQYVERELSRKAYGGQFMSFNAVFSPRGPDGQPMLLFDPKTGNIDRNVAEAWRKYDIVHILRKDWATLGPKLAGKLRVFVGTQDNIRLDEACRLLQQELTKLKSDGEVVFAEGRDHGDLYAPEAKLWPNGLLMRIHKEMFAAFKASQTK